MSEWYSRRRIYRNNEYDEIFKSDKFQEELENYNLFYLVQSYLCDTCLEVVGDIKRISSWGVVIENGEEKLVMIDFGLNDDIYDDYYKRK